MKKENDRFRDFIIKVVRNIFKLIFSQGINIDINSQELIFLTGDPKDSIKNLSLYLKLENRDNIIESKSKNNLLLSLLLS